MNKITGVRHETRGAARTKGYGLPARICAMVLLAAMLMTGCQSVVPPAETTALNNPPAATTESVSPTETQPAETEPPALSLLPDGNPNDVTCLGTYTAEDTDAAMAARDVVATVGEAELTNALLQIYYWTAVNSYREGGHDFAPNFDKPLATQLCSISEETITWQQYFLQTALDTWHSQQAMVSLSETYEFPTEEAYKIMEKRHAENIKEGMAALERLYGYNMGYKIVDAHQTYLDNLSSLLSTMAQDRGYEDLSALVRDLAGVATSDDYFLKYAELANKSYMFYATLAYHVEPTEEEVTAHFEANQKAYAAEGITANGSKYVTIRQILVTPDGGTTAKDGTVTYSAAEWTNCKSSAESLLNKWKKNASEVYFGELAYNNSDDAGSFGNGGLYTNIHQGQLTEELDAWCFDEARQTGDTTIIQTDSGCHILYFSDSADIWYVEAELDLISKTLHDFVDATMESYPMTVNYSAIRLGDAVADGLVISADDLIYPEVAHERFPDAPLYLQQDYGDTKYGNYTLRTYGCGITSMSMLTSYMLDEEWTPPEMCKLFGKYCGEKGTAHTLFLEAPAAMGFYAIQKVNSWSQAEAALKEGHVVITLQHNGYWTSRGHYLLLDNLTEDGQIMVWDSNLYNYGKLEGHTTGSFPATTIPPGSSMYWIYQKKVVSVATCARCGEVEAPADGKVIPTAMFAEDYFCPKCVEAMAKRSAFIEAFC